MVCFVKLIRWIVIYPVDSVIQPLNNRGQITNGARTYDHKRSVHFGSQTECALLITNGVRTPHHKRSAHSSSQTERALLITNGARTYDHKRRAHLWSQKERAFMITNGWHIFVRKRSGHTKTLQAVANVTCSNRHYALMNSKQRQHWKKARQLRNLLHHYLVSVWQWSR